MKCKLCTNELAGGELTQEPIGICDTCVLNDEYKKYLMSQKAKEALDDFFANI